MKKIMILAVAAIAMVACTKTYEVVETQAPEIGFNTWAEHLTKAEARVQGTNTFLAGDTFAVYGYKDKTSPAPATVFDDVVVTASGNPVSGWDYTNHRFWDSNYDSYTFFAISPSAIGTEADGNNSSTNVNPQTGAFVTRAITFAGNNNDILVADKKIVNKTDGSGNFNSFGVVPLVFNHVASLVDIKVKKAPSLSDATVTVSAFELSDIDNVGQLSVSDAYTASHPVASWTGTARTTYSPGSGVTPVSIASPIEIDEDDDFDPASPTTPSGSTFLVNNLVVLPQTFRASGGTNPQKITMTYKIAVTGSADVEFANKALYFYDFDNVNDADNNDSAIASWEPGKHYTFYITIDAHAISFSASITDWTSVSGYHYLVD